MKWTNVMKRVKKKNSPRLNVASHNTISWSYKGPTLHKVILFWGCSPHRRQIYILKHALMLLVYAILKRIRCNCTTLRMAKIQNTDNIKCCDVARACDITGTLFTHCGQKCKMIKTTYKTVCQFLTKVNILLSYDSAIILLGIYPKKLKACVYIKDYTWMFTTTLFIISLTVKQSK